MAGLCTLLALILIVACIYIVFCLTGEKVEKKSQKTLRECRRVHIPVKSKNIPPAPPMPLKRLP